MYALLALLVVASVSLLAVRIGAVAFEMTGLSRDVAAFQAQSAFTGVGYTTEEAERAVAYPARRRVVRALMLAGNVGTVTAISSLVLSFVGGPRTAPLRLAIIVGFSLGLFALARSQRFDRAITPVIERTLDRVSEFDVHDYTALLHLHRDYRVADVTVREDGWLAGETLADLDLPSEGVVVLGVRRGDGTYVGAPPADVRLHPGDTLIAYGKADRLRELAARSADDHAARADAEESYQQTLEAEAERDPERTAGAAGP